jgi:YHS domain-containing protein
MLRVFILSLLIACGGGGSKPTTTPDTSNKVLVLVDESGVGLGGNDPIAYTNNAVEPGVAEHTSKHGGATYQFANAENKAKFDAEAAKFAPGFGGYCAYAASQNRLSPSDPEAYMIYEGQLLMFTNAEFLELFKKDPAANKKAADANWPGLVAKHGK